MKFPPPYPHTGPRPWSAGCWFADCCLFCWSLVGGCSLLSAGGARRILHSNSTVVPLLSSKCPDGCQNTNLFSIVDDKPSFAQTSLEFPSYPYTVCAKAEYQRLLNSWQKESALFLRLYYFLEARLLTYTGRKKEKKHQNNASCVSGSLDIASNPVPHPSKHIRSSSFSYARFILSAALIFSTKQPPKISYRVKSRTQNISAKR
ncbi:hypothetical protein B0T19DRAFT_140344 [Cercophora scortea]|uniref:Uncharacterized protein n=1 Tax=Cercophora scortea TaxID=314031 RepID=A0AAE0IZ32_9PEZI|nr:hypothetical protein B0T19DRAFT_140344 [Cercophora scortea]